jgi:hypothetical protein
MKKAMKSKIKREKQMVERMIRLYCRRAEGNKELCNECGSLLDYAISRLNHCSYSDNKHACKECMKHCYKHSIRENIRRVMRFSGKRMILYAPLATIRHILKF